MGRGPGDVAPAVADRSGGGQELAGQHLEEGALAGAVGADEAAQLALGQGEIDRVHRHDATEAHGQAAGLEQGGGHDRALPERGAAAGSAGVATAAPGTVPEGRGAALHHGHDAGGEQQHEDEQDGAEHEIGVEHLLAADLGHEILDRDGAQHRADQRAEAADHHPDDDLGRGGEAEDRRADEGAPERVEAAGEPRDAAADDEGEELVEPRIVAEQGRPHLVLADRHHDPAEMAGEEQLQPDEDRDEAAGREVPIVLGRERIAVEGQGDARHRRNAVEAAERRGADPVGVAGGGIDDVEEDQRHRERDDADIDVGDAAVEHEIAEQRGEQHRHQHRQQDRHGAVGEVEGRHRIGIAAEAEEGRLAEGQDAAKAPDEAETERQHRHGDEDGGLQQREGLDELRRQARQDGGHEGAGEGEAERQEGADHRLPLKKRPVMPSGSTRIRRVAATSRITSPKTGVVR